MGGNLPLRARSPSSHSLLVPPPSSKTPMGHEQEMRLLQLQLLGRDAENGHCAPGLSPLACLPAEVRAFFFWFPRVLPAGPTRALFLGSLMALTQRLQQP